MSCYKNILNFLNIESGYLRDYFLIKTSGFNFKYNHLIYTDDIFFDPDLNLSYERLIIYSQNIYFNKLLSDIQIYNNIDKESYVYLLNFYSFEVYLKIINMLYINNITDDFTIEKYNKNTFQIYFLQTKSKKISELLNKSTFDNKPSIYQIIKYMHNDNLQNKIDLKIPTKKIVISKIKFPHLFSEIINTLVQNLYYYENNKFLNQLELYIQEYSLILEKCDINIFQEYNSVYLILTNLIFIYLTYTCPYNTKDYNDSLLNINQFIFQNMGNNIYFENYILNSASDALYIIHTVTGIFNKKIYNDSGNVQLLFINIASYIDKFTPDAVYHEYEEIKTSKHSKNIIIYFVGFNSNHNLNNGINDLELEIEIIDKIKNNYIVFLIIDQTFEYCEPNLLDLYTQKYNNLIIQQKMVILYIKSLQKFVLLGSGKIKFGAMGIICNNYEGYFNCIIDYLKKYSDDLFKVNYQNIQLMIHYLKYGRSSELKYVDTILSTIKKLQNNDLWKKNKDLLLANGPFIYIKKKYEGTELALKKIFPKVSTFGETITTWGFGNYKYYRISIGLEPVEILVGNISKLMNNITLIKN
jgi:hypothetical protein